MVDANNIAGMQDDFDSFEIPPTQTATSYLLQLADKTITGKFERLLADDAHQKSETLGISMHDRLDDLLTLLMMRASIHEIVIGRYNDSPFYINHPDLHNRNIIIQGKPVVDEFSRSHRLFSTNESHCLHQIHNAAGTTSSEAMSKENIKVAGVVD